MAGTKYLRGACTSCSASIQFPAESIGSTTTCPYCGKPTELLLPTPPEEPPVPRKMVVWTLTAVLILVLGVVGSVTALKLAQHWAAEHRQNTSQPAKP